MVATRFDRERLTQEFAETARRKQQSLEVAHGLLLDYVQMAEELDVPLWEIKRDGNGARLVEIILKSWPVASNQAFQYYPLLTNSQYDPPLANELGGFMVTPNGDFFVKGGKVSASEAANWLAGVSGFDPVRVQSLLEDALRGNPGHI